MPKLPQCSGSEAVRAFKKLGYEEQKRKSAYTRLVCPGKEPLSVPSHPTLAKGTLRHLIKNSGFTVEDFNDVL